MIKRSEDVWKVIRYLMDGGQCLFVVAGGSRVFKNPVSDSCIQGRETWLLKKDGEIIFLINGDEDKLKFYHKFFSDLGLSLSQGLPIGKMDEGKVRKASSDEIYVFYS